MANLWDPVIVYDSAEASYWEAQTRLPDTQMVPLSASAVTGSYMEAKFTRTVQAGLREDMAQIGMHFSVEAGPGAPMSRLDSADALRVAGAFNSDVWQPIYGQIANDWSLKEITFRHFAADYPLDKNGLSKKGPVWYLLPVAQAGTNTNARLPDQVALTTTYRTASRKHWGRNYFGGFTTAALTDAQMGHAVTTTVDLLSGSLRAFLNDINDDARKTTMWIWSPKYRGACSVNELSVDDTFDVVRRRRAKMPSYRKTYTA